MPNFSKKLPSIILWYLWKLQYLSKTSAIGDITGSGYSEVDNTNMKNASMDGVIIDSASIKNVRTSAGTIDNNKPGGDRR